MHDCKTVLYNYVHMKEKCRANKDICEMHTPRNTNPHNMDRILYFPLNRVDHCFIILMDSWLVLIIFSVLKHVFLISQVFHLITTEINFI